MRHRPNIVFILADDLGWRDLGVEGSSFYETPNIDRIAGEGMRFTQGYATCQVCSPSRASILTGTYPTRHGITDWIGASHGEAWRDGGRFNRLMPPAYRHSLPRGEITLADSFRDQGYRTFFAGKWHLGGEGSYPEDHGFEVNIGGWEAGSPQGGYFAPFVNPKLPPGPDGESLPIRLGTETARFIEANRREPFLAYLSFYSVHGPIETDRELWEKYRRKATEFGESSQSRFIFDRYLPVRQLQDCPIYAGMIEAMDSAIGIVLDALDRTGLGDDTIICFTSDNGGVSAGDSYSTSNLPLRGGKGRQWEGGIREPFYIRAPGIAAPGSRCDVPVSGIDFFPTLLNLANIPEPDKIIDGISLAPLLRRDTSDTIAERDLLWHYPHYGNQGGEPSSIIRSGNYKLIHYYEGIAGRNEDELYDLASDPGEQRDLLAGTARTTSEELGRDLRRRLESWLEETGAKLPEIDPEYNEEAEAARLELMAGEFMEKLEAQHAEYLDPEWQPNEDWWGSMVVED